MAIYPDDATVSASAFATLSSGTKVYTNTSSTTTFPLPITVSYVGEVFVTLDGITQTIDSYYLSNNNGSISFYAAPAATEMVIRCIDLPARYRKLKSSPTLAVYHVKYSNTSFTAVGGNSYILNGVQTAFPIPEAALGQSVQANAIFVTVSGVMQDQTNYTYPSTVLGLNGIDFEEAPAVFGNSSSFANTVVEIRAFVTESSYISRFTDMRDRKPNNGFMTTNQFNVSKYSTQAGYEKRRLLSRRQKRSYQLTYTNVSGVEKEAVENFYRARNGEYDTFTFDLTHINDTGTVRTRFNGPLEIQQVISSGISLTQNFYNIRFNLQEDFD
jgi:hypothetical protein